MTKQSLKILPMTALGRWSVGLVSAMLLLLMIGSSLTNSVYAAVPAGDTILADIAVRPALALSMLAGLAAGIAAFITGLLAIIKKEKALLVYVSGTLGGLLLLFLAGEILFPH